MKKRRIKYSDVFEKNERPYYIKKDNENSRVRISKITSFRSVEEIVQDKKITKALVIDNYFDTDYMKKIKKESIKYPVSNELEK